MSVDRAEVAHSREITPTNKHSSAMSDMDAESVQSQISEVTFVSTKASN